MPAVVLTGLFSGMAQWILPMLGLASIGMAHGAVDHEWDSLAKTSPVKFYSNYLFQIAIYLVLCRFAPFAALLVFIAISAQHFGECEFAEGSQNDPKARLAAWLWGLCASLFGPLYHWSETLPIVERMGFPIQLTFESPRSVAVLLGALGLVAAGCRSQRSLFRTPLLLCALAILPLLPGFLCFFVFWHSWDSVQHQRLQKNWVWKQYLKKCAPYTVLAWLGICVLIGFKVATGDLVSLWPAFFSAIGALTLSHSQVMKRFYQSAKKKPDP